MPEYRKSDGLTYKRWVEITPNDSDEVANVSAIMVTDDTSGNAVAVEGNDGNSEVLYLIKGVMYPIEVLKVLSTGTNADTIMGFE